jgi:tetratricopeptide (TPR) repeat protein
VIALFVLLALLIPSVARGEGEHAPAFSSADAARRYQAASRAFQAQDYDQAITEAQAGNALELRVEFLYLLGQAERMRHNCRKAVEHYEAALAIASSHAQMGAIRIQIARCEKALADEPSPPSSPPAALEPPAATNANDAAMLPPPTTESAAAPRRAWYRDPVGGALFGGGVAVLAVGAGLFGASEAAFHDANVDSQQYADARGMQPMHVAGITLLAVGTGGVLAGVIRYAWVHRHPR